MRPVFDKSKGPRAIGSSSTAWWTLLPCQVTVRPRDHRRFWGEVKAKAEGLSDGADAVAGPAVSGVQPVPSRVPASDPVGPTGQDMAGAAASSEGLQAFPVLQGTTHNTYQPLAWQALAELRDAVRKYGLGSAEVMQVLLYFNASLLTSFDIQSLARTLFPPVEYDFFENRWTQLAVRAVEWNATLGPGDPRHMVNTDMLLGTGNYTRANRQAGFEPLVQEQCQQTGMAALVQTIQLATPQESFVTVIQGVDEPFLHFAGRLTAAVEKQGMRNSPVLCQWYVARALSGVRKQFPDAHIYHYMDDILVATPTQDELLRIQPQLLNALHSHGLQVAPEKVQQQPPWKYLGVKILERTICHQEVQFVQSVKTLNDAQKLVGVITWLRPYLGLTTAQLSPLFELLKGDTDLKSPRELTPEARKAMEEVQQAVSACQVYRIEPSIDVTVFITTPDLHPTGIIGQWNDDWTDPLHILEWVFLPHQPHKTATALFEWIARLIIKCRQRCLQLMGADPSKIILPIQRKEFDWSYANNVSLQSALEGFSGQITYHLPSHKLLQVAKNTQFSLRPKNSQEPVQGPTVFTDGSGKTGKAIVTWQDGSEWQVLEGHEDGSAQLVELRAAVMAFEKFSQEPFNLIMDSAYVANIAQRLGYSVLKEVSNPALFNLLKALWCAIQARVHPYNVLHVWSHTNLPGFVAEGVNPRGLKALELWQIDVTQVAEFGRLKYVHVTVDTFSSAMWASAHTGEKARDVIAHWRQAFAVLGIPSAVKTDNGPVLPPLRRSDLVQERHGSHTQAARTTSSQTPVWWTANGVY
ncbi:hypothetical protein DUI87_03360 [Hirundo rustica rustica]|uniref:ribonuclease H n=1 Tax=Hirundo rustica rustica TaxID=333673 RepID=A0A3M0L2W7_HIRRU|nr:hypothetical protein DUI87_03360 [Hirundo rustica rustica]